MKKFETAKQRMIYFLESQNISRNKFYSISGASNGLLDTKGGLNESTILKIIETFPQLNLYWLLLEKGEMLRPEGQNAAGNTADREKIIALQDEIIALQREVNDLLREKSSPAVKPTLKQG